jgi:hypothetical protein
MYCFKCGKQIRDDAAFCQYCGAKQNSTASSIETRQTNSVARVNGSGELDRDALKIYLGNVLSLECIKAKYQQEASDMQYKIKNTKGRYNYYKRYYLRTRKSDKLYIHLMYDGEFHLAWYDKGDGYGPYTVYSLEAYKWHSDNPRWHWFSWKKDSEIDFLRKPAYWEYTADSSGFWGMSDRTESRDAFFKSYEEFKREALSAYQNIVDTNNKNINIWQSQIDGMNRELVTVNKLLRQAYDINIIPSQFRNKIHAIYYLHDFVSTSRESFTTALLQYDLDEIKAKLDKIIAQQESIIIQNAVMIAQNENLTKQNQQQLEHLSRIESNTSQAAQYAQVAANNAEICAWISTANYIEKHR